MNVSEPDGWCDALTVVFRETPTVVAKETVDSSEEGTAWLSAGPDAAGGIQCLSFGVRHDGYAATMGI
jgi:hypothetical protein